MHSFIWHKQIQQIMLTFSVLPGLMISGLLYPDKILLRRTRWVWTERLMTTALSEDILFHEKHSILLTACRSLNQIQVQGHYVMTADGHFDVPTGTQSIIVCTIHVLYLEHYNNYGQSPLLFHLTEFTIYVAMVTERSNCKVISMSWLKSSKLLHRSSLNFGVA